MKFCYSLSKGDLVLWKIIILNGNCQKKKKEKKKERKKERKKEWKKEKKSKNKEIQYKICSE